VDFLLKEDFPKSSFCSSGIRFGGFLVSYISSVATLTMTTGKCAKRYRNIRGALRISNTAGAKGWQEITFSAEFRIPPEQLLRNILLQQALEFRRRNLTLLRYPPEQPLLSSCGLVPPRQSKLLCRKSSSKRKSRAKVHPGGSHFEIIQV
jgi:hypothetical protein